MNGEEKKTILAVDDNPQILKLTNRALGRFCTVLTASTADEAIKIITEQRSNLVAVISDWDIGGTLMGDGEHVIRTAKNLGIEHKIAVSGRAGEPCVNEAMREAGATIIFTKGDEGFVAKMKSLIK